MLGVSFRYRGASSISLSAHDGNAQGHAAILLSGVHLLPFKPVLVRPRLDRFAHCSIFWSARDLRTGHVKTGHVTGPWIQTVDIWPF
ncbi:hypothetical protein SAMN02745857_02770 [Andreprevotia lacus DSM 23236]|jgi:hypothetical protein|uniref:Uncharacterized protein n=1 Tax=Andreprevotia lacus DSM 23236 TaxID=1121001 RepID=A0A1W1XTP2_9NEIS|nr:hypothetical protein [Andreprevotia lacus]SMC27256.1 hypothetical protein SAMN02745857_02770 [Andreprevotia lacus DSM 23236]